MKGYTNVSAGECTLNIKKVHFYEYWGCLVNRQIGCKSDRLAGERMH